MKKLIASALAVFAIATFAPEAQSQITKRIKRDASTTTTEQPSAAEEPAINTGNSKSDFVRGSQQFFFDDVTKEKVGEFPSMWDVLTADEEVEVATVNGEKAIKIIGWGTRIMPLIKQKEFLGDEFTIEFDVYTDKRGEAGNHTIGIDFCDQHHYPDYNGTVANFFFNPAGKETARMEYLKVSGTDDDQSFTAEASEDTVDKILKKNAWNSVEISFNTRAMKIYINGTRIINVPNMAKPKWLHLVTWANAEDEFDNFFYVKNFRICNGSQELYGRNQSSNEVEQAMAATGKFVTNNILFETGKADLKAESMTEIEKVAAYMKANPSVRFEVQGHCDNQGSDKVNDPLSQKRSEAIVAALVKLGVDEWNLRAVGKGSHEPVADNSTEEGRAKNRRVEFIKK